ncbi:MAG: SOS response-associated peptidase [Euryarchaeota archaeon]|nr:SOS response-associated peptidase [Euryarchaeota archaeon]
MCGRFSLFTVAEVVQRLFGLGEVPDYPKRYNVCPTDDIVVVRAGGDAAGEPERVGRLMRWGFVPTWAKDPEGMPLMINAKAESVFEKPAFRTAAKHQRCLVPADGFYEWKKLKGGEKQPMFIRLQDDRPMALAGLWSEWSGKLEGEEVAFQSCVILTTDTNDLLRPVHDRMPVIMDQDGWSLWLDPTIDDPELLHPLLAPFDAARMKMWPVSRKVNKPQADGAELIEPKGQQTLF